MVAYKYHGAGNDFVILDFFDEEINLSALDIKNICDRNFGIGADGLIKIMKAKSADFKMQYYNSDGNEAAMCGNGARCAVAFAFSKKYCKNKTIFEASDGLHEGEVLSCENKEYLIKISLNIENAPKRLPDGSYFANTGVPHNVRIYPNIGSLDVKILGAKFRNDKALFPEGANINFVEIQADKIKIRTFERGVEDETLACGTGITAVALVLNSFFDIQFPITIYAAGGKLRVLKEQNKFFLEGPAAYVFDAINF